MGIFDRNKDATARVEVHKAIGSSLLQGLFPTYYSTITDPTDYSYDLILKVKDQCAPWGNGVFFIVTQVARLSFESGDQYIDSILESPSRRSNTLSRYLKRITNNLMDYGNAYVRITRNRSNKRPVGLMVLRPDKVEVKEEDDGFLHYYLKVNGTHEKEEIPDEDIIHMRDDDNGRSTSASRGHRMLPLAYAHIGLTYLTDRNIESSRRAFVWAKLADDILSRAERERFLADLDKMGIKDPQEQSDKVHELTVKRRDSISENIIGESKTGGPKVVLTNKAIEDIQWVKPPPLEEQYADNVHDRQLNGMAATLGVPPVKLGIKASERFSNERARFISFYSETLFPLLIEIEQQHTVKMFTKKQRQAGMKIQFRSLEIIAGDLVSLNLIASGGLSNAMTVNDLRSLLRESTLDQGDELMGSANAGNRNESGDPLNPFAGEDERNPTGENDSSAQS